MKANDLVALALRTPLNALMGDTMLITVTGRKTGRKITLPVNYTRHGNSLWILSSRDRTWWRNLSQCGEVILHLHGRDAIGFGELILDEAAVEAGLAEYVRHLPVAARSMGVRVENGVLNSDDLRRVSQERLLIKVCLVT